MSIRDIDDVQKFIKFVLTILYIDDVINDDTSNSLIIAIIIRRIHLIDDLKMKILVNQDIMTFEKMLLNFEH